MLKQKMYSLVLYSLSDIQKGIQSYHAGIEYSLKHGDTDEYKQWSQFDKTVIILNGGTTSNFDKHVNELFENEVRLAWFEEPDLNCITTAITFLVDEKVWDKEKYPDPVNLSGSIDDYTFSQLVSWYGEKVAFLRLFLKQFKLA